FSAPTSPTLGGGELAPPSDTPSPTPPPRWGPWRRLRLLLSVFALGCGAAALSAAASLPSDRPASAPSSPGSAPHFPPHHPPPRRREHRPEELQLPPTVPGGGRLRGCSKQRRPGRPNRLYPGPAVHPAVLVRQLIEADDQREAAITEQLDGSPPPTRGERLAS